MRKNEKVLVFRIGQLGDTLVALPALWAIRKHFPKAHLTLLCDRHPGKDCVLAADLFGNTPLFNSFETYPVVQSRGGRLLKPFRMLSLLQRLRQQRFDTLVYLAPSLRTHKQIERDRQFFRAAGIRVFIGMHDISASLPAMPRPLPRVPNEADQLLQRLTADGIPVPPPGEGRTDLALTDTEEREVAQWLSNLPSDEGKRWIGIGPGSKMAAKKWRLERFNQAGLELIDRFDVWPVVFGGPEDRSTGDQMLRTWKRGYNAAGQLGLRAAAAALKRCLLYFGNDTGTMHLAAAVGTPCVAIFSARDWPGKWHPYGRGHRNLRAEIDCEGCGLVQCIERKNECLDRIQASDAIKACGELLELRLANQPAAARYAEQSG